MIIRIDHGLPIAENVWRNGYMNVFTSKHTIQQPIRYFILARLLLRFLVLKAWDPLGGSQIFSNEIQSYKKNIAGEASSGQIWRTPQNMNKDTCNTLLWCFLNIFSEILEDIIYICNIAGEASSGQIWRAPQNMNKDTCNILIWCFLNIFFRNIRRYYIYL